LQTQVVAIALQAAEAAAAKHELLHCTCPAGRLKAPLWTRMYGLEEDLQEFTSQKCSLADPVALLYCLNAGLVLRSKHGAV
jgi:hypothetical protein